MDSYLVDRIEREKNTKVLVRKFSSQWNQDEPDNPLAQGLETYLKGPEHLADRQGKFRDLYADPNDNELIDSAKTHLNDSTQRLNEAWDKYLEEKKVNNEKKSDYVFQSSSDDIFAEFATHIESAVEEWKKRNKSMGKVREYITSCCNTLTNYSNFFSIIPSDSHYCALFCNVVKTLVKAGANYKETATKLDASLNLINEQVKTCVLNRNLINTKEIRILVIQLYSELFELLRLILQHFTSKLARFWGAFNENYFEKSFGQHIKNASTITEKIQRRAEMGSRGEIRDTRLLLIDMFCKMDSEARQNQLHRDALSKDVREWKEGIYQQLSDIKADLNAMYDIAQPQIASFSDALLREAALGALVNKCLIQGNFGGELFNAFSENSVRLPPTYRPDGTYGNDIAAQLTPQNYTSEDTKVPGQVTRYTIQEIQENAQNIRALLLRNPLADFSVPVDSGVLSEPTVTTELQLWTLSQKSQILWLNGREGGKQRSSFTNLAAVVVSKGLEFHINTMYFSCNPYADEYASSDDDGQNHRQCLLDLVYVFIWQLVSILPDHLDTNIDFSLSRFNSLSGEYASLRNAVSLLEDLLNLAPTDTIMILDGIERLNHDLVVDDVKYVLELLILYVKEPDVGERQPVSVFGTYEKAEKVMKMLITTVQPCDALADLYSQYENAIKRVLVSWKKWHQYGKKIELFEG